MNIDFYFACNDDCLQKMLPSDLRKLVCERDSALSDLEIASKRISEVEKSEDALIAERDELAELLDSFVSELSRLFDDRFGEHASANNPWLNALEYLNSCEVKK